MSQTKELSNMEPAQNAAVNLGRWLGRREAFGLIAGRCSAAEAESLRRIRDERSYLQVAKTWAEFCERRLGIHPRKVQRTLRLLDEFGPSYFHVAQMAHVTPDEYRAIARHVSEEGVRLDGAVVALLPENTEQVSAAVAELIERERPAKAAPAECAADTVLKRCGSAADELAAFAGGLDPVQRLKLTSELCRLLRAAASHGVLVPRL